MLETWHINRLKKNKNIVYNGELCFICNLPLYDGIPYDCSMCGVVTCWKCTGVIRSIYKQIKFLNYSRNFSVYVCHLCGEKEYFLRTLLSGKGSFFASETLNKRIDVMNHLTIDPALPNTGTCSKCYKMVMLCKNQLTVHTHRIGGIKCSGSKKICVEMMRRVFGS